MEKERITILRKSDCDISYFKGSGAGGQNKQKNATGVQIIHRESGAIGRNSETRSQDQNRRAAFKSLTETPKFKVWLNKKLYEIRQQETIEETVEKMMVPENLKIEMLEDDKWVPYEEKVSET
jgi:protein subunit release factor B